MTQTIDISLEGLFEAYWDCRRNKSRTRNASAFEADYEANLVDLRREIAAGKYRPGRSIAFIVDKPVKREIFAADFRDRIVHHWIALRIEPLLEEAFIPETFNCRKGKGNSAGIEYLHQAVRECSENYTRDSWILRLDLQSFFTSIDRRPACEKLCRFIGQRYRGEDLAALLHLTRVVLLNAPEENCIIKGDRSRWEGLAPGKSLFTNQDEHGLPIGNFTSQLTGNFILNDTDHYIREELGLCVARYVDDICIVDQSKERLLAAIPLIREHLFTVAGATLHPRKFYLQHYTKGVKFIGAVIKRERIYISNRTVSNAYQAVHSFNLQAQAPGFVEKNAEAFASCINSYLGIMKHYRTYAIRCRLTERIAPQWLKVIEISEDHTKLIVKKRYKYRERVKYVVKRQRKPHNPHVKQPQY